MSGRDPVYKWDVVIMAGELTLGGLRGVDVAKMPRSPVMSNRVPWVSSRHDDDEAPCWG